MSERNISVQPVPTKQAEGVGALLGAADKVRRYLSAAIEPFGITGQQYNVLRILRGAHPEPLPTLEVAERMLEPTPGITRLIDRLEKKDLVAREGHREDRRQVLCAITPEGLELLEAMDKPVSTANTELLSMLAEQELDDLVRLLEAIQREGA